MKKWIIGCLLLVTGLLFSAKGAQAQANDSVVNSPYYRDAYTDKIPADNTFIMRNGEATTIEKLSGVLDGDTVITGLDSVKESSVLIRNVGFYQGKNVNVRATITMLKPAGTDMIVSKTNFLRLRIFSSGVAQVSYEFLDDQLQPFPLKTTFNEMGLNKWKDLTILNPAATVDAFYATPDSTIQYTEDDQGLTLHSTSNHWKNDQSKLAITTKEISAFVFTLKNNDTKPAPQGISEVQYLSQFFPEIEFPLANPQQLPVQKIVNNEVTTSFQQTIPYTEKRSVLPELSYKVANLPQNQFQMKNVTVKDFCGNDRTTWFDQQFDEQGNLLISAKPEILANETFYDNSYLFTIHQTFIGSKDNPVDQTILEENCLRLQTQITENFGTGEQNIGISESPIDYLSGVNVIYVDEQNQPLLEAGCVTDIITSTVDLSLFYPALEGYYPIHESREKDQVTVTPEEQTVYHHYRKGQPLLFALKDTENPMLIPRFSKKKTLAYTFSHDPEVAVQVVAECGNQRQVLKEYEKGNQKLEDTATFTVPTNWMNQEVSFYLENQQGERSTSEVRTLSSEKGPQLVLPKNLSFGTQAIPAADCFVTAVNQNEIRVEDQSQLEKSQWTVKVRMERPMKNEAQVELKNPFHFRIQAKETVISTEDTPIWTGTGSAALGQEDRLQLALHPADQMGSYQGSLIWTLEDAPR
jgi:hypothetical protein